MRKEIHYLQVHEVLQINIRKSHPIKRDDNTRNNSKLSSDAKITYQGEEKKVSREKLIARLPDEMKSSPYEPTLIPFHRRL